MGEPPSDASGHRARLRRRLFEGGPKALLDHELVEYLLALAIPRRDTKAQAKKLIAQFGGIGPLLAADAETLKREGLSEGVVAALKIAEATALRLLETRLEGRPLLSSWEALQDYLQAAMAFACRGSARPVPQCEEHADRQRNNVARIRRRRIDACPRSHEARDGAWRDCDHHRP